MKETELKLIAGLMRNSRRSDRELAKAIRVPQPTVTRMIRRLEKEGVIKEYTMISDFSKLGYRPLTLSYLAKGLLPPTKEKPLQKKTV
jgi:DNA-binding Lrp family transcriptional regulator